jgi:hypothetical protein
MIIVGYDRQGNPILAPAEFENEPLPALAPAPQGSSPSDVSLANSMAQSGSEPSSPMEDQYNDPPPEVLQDAENMPAMPDESQGTAVRRAEPVAQAKGVHWNMQPIDEIAALFAAGRRDEAIAMRDAYKSASPINAYVYDNIKGKSRVTARYAAGLADSYRQMQDRIALKMADPAKQAQIDEKDRVKKDFEIRRNSMISTIEDILKDKEYAEIVGPWDGTVGAALDASNATETNRNRQVKRARLDRLVNVDVLDMTKYLRPISQDELKYLRTLVPKSTQGWDVYKQYLSEKLNMLKSADKPLANPASGQWLQDNSGEAQAAQSQAQPNLYQQSQQNPAAQLRQQIESQEELELPNGQKLRKVTNPDGTTGWE